MTQAEKEFCTKALLEARAIYNTSSQKFDEVEQKIKEEVPDNEATEYIMCELFDKTFNTSCSESELAGILDLFLIEEEKCPVCQGEKNCSNCYWGQVETKEPLPTCEDCSCVGSHKNNPSNWTSLGDIYCRECGRKLC